ncbi:hypothetical protein GFS31_02770 [Leptolyngbya sp. BL0902]|nr:hypothetical protein GFS31_02770 [Leptolyngbya sp. BL0902]
MPSLPSLEDTLQRRWGNPWLLGPEVLPIWPIIDEISQKLAAQPSSLCANPSDYPMAAILVAEVDPVRCLAATLAGLRRGFTVALANPRWGQREWQQVDEVLQPDRSQPLVPDWELYVAKLPPTEIPEIKTPELLITTGGSGGQIKFARHTWETLMASVQGFQAHFQIATVNAYCVLPLYHVSGLMQALRTLATNGQLILQPYAELKQGQPFPLPAENPGFLSLVPTQLQELLNQGDTYLPWLRQFQAILLGGATPWPALLTQARTLSLPLAPTYGMTETASQVATLRPDEFLAGQTGSGRPLPHATISVLDDHHQPQPPNQPGRLAITAPSLFKGYLRVPDSRLPTPDSRLPTPDSPFLTDDIGYLNDQGYLHILGRHSTTLITGGEKVQPEELESLLLTTDLVQAVCIVGLPDAHWGQAVCALVVPQPGVALAQLADWLAPQVVPYKRPKYWMAVNALPQTAQGKVDRRAALAMARRLITD